MRTLMIVLGLVVALAPAGASAQPAGSADAGSAAAGSASAPAAGSAAAGSAAAGSAAAGSASAPAGAAAAPDPASAPAPAAAPSRTPQELRQICADAMNADPTFAEAIAKTVNEETARQHRQAAAAIAKNERHVILAYGAMWVLAAGFVLFLWRRQQALRTEITQLRRDLEAASK